MVTAAPETPLLYVLRNDLGLNGPKFGCGLGQCGACAASVGGRLTRTCSITLRDVGNDPIITLEGLGTLQRPHPLQKAFIEEQAAQCGYCSNGMIMAAKALLDRNPKPSDEEIKDAGATHYLEHLLFKGTANAIRRQALPPLKY